MHRKTIPLLKPLKNEKGELMIESCIIVLFTIIFLFFVLALGLLIYQKSLQTLVANETSVMISKNYWSSATSSDPVKVPQSADELIVFSFLGTGSKGTVNAEANKAAREYALNRLKMTSLALIEDDESSVSVNVSVYHDGYYSYITKVDLDVKYDFLFGGMFNGAINGFELTGGIRNTSLLTITSSASASATDLSYYINDSTAQLRFMNSVCDTAVDILGEGLTESMTKLVERVRSLYDRFH